MRARDLAYIAQVMFFLAATQGCSSPPPRPPRFFPAPPDPPRVQVLKTYASSHDVEEKPSLFREFILGSRAYSETIPLGKVWGSAFFDGKLYVCDTSNGAVFVLDFDGHHASQLGRGTLKEPIAIAIAEDGTKYVSDMGRNAVFVFGSNDDHIATFGEKNTPDKKKDLWAPCGVAVSGDRLYVTDMGAHKVRVVDRKTGKPILDIGKPGWQNGALNRPLAIAADREGNVYVTDAFNFRIQKFDPTGRFVRAVGSVGRTTGQFARPRGVAVDGEGRLFVVDAAFNNVQIFNKEGRLLLAVGSLGNTPGDLYLPSGISIDEKAKALFADEVAPGRELEEVFFVSSQYGPNRLTVYGLLKPSADDAKVTPTAPSTTGTPGANAPKGAEDMGAWTPDEWVSDQEKAKAKQPEPTGGEQKPAPSGGGVQK